MKKIILSALIALTALGGVASADRGHRGERARHAQGGVVVSPSRGHYQQPRRVYQQPRHYTYNRGHYVSRPTYRYVRRPIYVQRPVVQYRYYNYAQRPVVLAENYRSIPGYYWVAGQWTWNGYEWTWTAGHYEPDPNASGYYSNSYDSQYYSENPNYDASFEAGVYYNNQY